MAQLVGRNQQRSIEIMTPYADQVFRIRSKLKQQFDTVSHPGVRITGYIRIIHVSFFCICKFMIFILNFVSRICITTLFQSSPCQSESQKRTQVHMIRTKVPSKSRCPSSIFSTPCARSVKITQVCIGAMTLRYRYLRRFTAVCTLRRKDATCKSSLREFLRISIGEIP